MFGRKKEPDPARVAEREALVARARADAARVKEIIPRLKALDNFGGLNTRDAANILAKRLEETESIDGALWGHRDDDKVLLVATSRRVLLLRVNSQMKLFFKEEVSTIDYSKITGIEQSRGLLHAEVVIAAGLSTIKITKACAHHVPAFIEAVQSNVNGPGKAAVAAQAPAADDPADQLRKLAALRDDGIITSEDFDAKKRQLLGL